LSLLPDDDFEALAHGNWNVGPPDPSLIYTVRPGLFFKPEDADFLAAVRSSGARLQQYAAWDYGRQAHGLCRVWGIVTPGAPPILWILESKVWTQTGAIAAAADAKLTHARIGLDLPYEDVCLEAGDPSGMAGDSGEGWFRTLAAQRLHMVDLKHSPLIGSEDQRMVYWNTLQGFHLTIDLAQAMMDRGSLRICDWHHCATLVDSVREWRYAIPEGQRPIDCDRKQLRKGEGKHSHPGDCLRYQAAFVHASVKAQANPINDLTARATPRRVTTSSAARNLRI
jgi:hypothetical protein